MQNLQNDSPKRSGKSSIDIHRRCVDKIVSNGITFRDKSRKIEEKKKNGTKIIFYDPGESHRGCE